MPTYRKQTLGTAGSVTPAVAPLGALKPLLAQPAVEVMRALDRVAQQGRRVVYSSGIQNTNEWGVPETNPASASTSRTYPDRTTWRTRARARVNLTPGHTLIATGWCLPAGETQRAGVGGGLEPLPWYSDGRLGRVRITATFRNHDGGSTTATKTITTPASTLQYGATDHSAGAAFRDAHDLGPVALMPHNFLTDASVCRQYSRGATVDILIETVGSPRIGQLLIHETPTAWAVRDDDASTYRTQAAYGNTPDAPHLLPKFPRYRNSTTDPRGGTFGILATAAAQRNLLGPLLIQWDAFREGYQTPTADYSAFSTTSDTFVNILDTTLTTWSATSPGFSVSCGGYARTWKDAGYFVFRERTAVIPVIARVYGRGVTAGTSTVRVQTSLCSFVDVVLPVGSAAWATTYGWLEVGINPDQASNAMVFARHVGASGSCEVEAVCVEYAAIAAAA